MKLSLYKKIMSEFNDSRDIAYEIEYELPLRSVVFAIFSILNCRV